LSRIPWRPGDVDDAVPVVPEYLYVLDQNLPPVGHESDWPLYLLYDDDVVPVDIKSRLQADQKNWKVTEDKVVLKCRGDDDWVPFVPFVERAELISKYHIQAGHASVKTMMHLMESRWWWPQMDRDVRKWLETCQECQLAGRPNKSKKQARLHPMESSKPFARWHLDFVGELPVTRQGNRWILVAVDAATNWPIARAYQDASATTVANFLYQEIVLRFGCPQEVVSDRGSQFMSEVIAKYTKRIHINHKFTSAFHPRSNGKVERVNGMIKSMLRKYLHGAIHEWDLYLDSAVWALRIRKHAATGYSPFFLVYGREPVLPGDSLRPHLSKAENQDDKSVFARTAKELEDLGQARAAAEFRAKSYTAKVKERWDAVIKPVGFDIGELVLLRLEKRYGLEYNWEGPYRVVKKNEQTDVYQLETYGGVVKSDWVHVDRLKKVKSVKKIHDTKPWFDVAASRARWPAGALRDHSIVDMSSSLSSSVLPELTADNQDAGGQVEKTIGAADNQVEETIGAAADQVEEVNGRSVVHSGEDWLPPEEDVYIPEEVVENELLPEEDELVEENIGVQDSGIADDFLEIDPDKMFDCCMDEENKKKQENWEQEKIQKAADGKQEKPPSPFVDSDSDPDLDVRGRTSSLGGSVVRSWPKSNKGVPVVIPSLGKRLVKRTVLPRKKAVQ
jgi:transposase InsO family protein